MKYIIKSIINRITKKDLPKPLGRWNIDYCDKKMDNKVDLSNEDHCGPCGQYAIDKADTNEIEKPTTSNKDVSK